MEEIALYTYIQNAPPSYQVVLNVLNVLNVRCEYSGGAFPTAPYRSISSISSTPPLVLGRFGSCMISTSWLARWASKSRFHELLCFRS